MQAKLLVVVTLAYIIVGYVWPTVRVWRKSGVWPVVFKRRAEPGQRALGFASKLLFIGIVALATANAVFGPEALGLWKLPVTMRAVGWLLIAGGFALTIAGHRRMGEHWRAGIDDRPTALVIYGIFGWMRNPVFTGLYVFMAGYLMLIPDWWTWVAWPVIFIGLRQQVLSEERHLIKQHGEAYCEYSSAVGRFLPWIGRLRFEGKTIANQGRS